VALIDNAIYVDGTRVRSPDDLRDTSRGLQETGGLAWIGLVRPTAHELQSVADEFDLHPLAVQDALKGHQRAKLERYGDTLFVVLRPTWYVDSTETVEFGEVHVFAGPGFLITVRHADRPDLSRVRARLEQDPAALCRGSEEVLATILDEVVGGYLPVVLGLQNDIDEIEDSLFAGRVDPNASKRIYQLLSEVIKFQRAIGPLPDMLSALLRGADKYGTDEEVQHHLRHLLERALRVTERVDGFRTLLENALTLHATLVSQEQNEGMRRMTSASLAQGEESRRLAKASMDQGEEVKKISSWAAILFAPTLIAGIYGMNFDVMPELHWRFGYPFALLLMLGMSVLLWVVFKRKHWL
jgi:magnesium transporter